MAIRLLCTIAMVLLAAGGFLAAEPSLAGTFNPLGLLFLLVSGVVWFAWEPMREGFAASGEVPKLWMVRIAPLLSRGAETCGAPPRTQRKSNDRTE